MADQLTEEPGQPSEAAADRREADDSAARSRSPHRAVPPPEPAAIGRKCIITKLGRIFKTNRRLAASLGVERDWDGAFVSRECEGSIIAQGPNPENQSEMCVAVRLDDTDEVVLIAEEGIAFRYSTTQEAAFFEAVLEGDAETLASLVAAGAAPVNATDRYGGRAVHHAARYGYDACLAELVKARADLQATDSKGWTAVHRAAETGRTDCLAQLLQAGAEVHATDTEGRTALHRAAFSKNSGCVTQLLEAKADVNAQMKDGRTPLALVRDPCSLSGVEKLLKKAGGHV